MNRSANRRHHANSARSRRDRRRRSMIIAAVAAVLLLTAAYVAQRRAIVPPIVQAISESEVGDKLLPLAEPIKPLTGGHEMSLIPASPPRPEPVTEGAQVPKVELPLTTFDFGEIPVTPAVSFVYAVQNTGTTDLHLSNLVTSCGCTTAELSTTIIPPGQRADLQVIFDPGFHETVGPVTRVVWMITDDPTQPWLEVKLTADVLPTP